VTVISLARGVPDPALLPIGEIAECARTVVGRDAAGLLAYGPPGGHPELREGIAARHDVDPGRVLVTNGSLQGIALVAGHLLAGGTRRVLVEAPTYDRSRKLLAHLGAELVAVPVDDEGLDVAALEARLRSGPRPAFLYTIPTFQNPTGTTLSLARRLRLAQLARAYDLVVVEDDPYALVRMDGEPLPTLFELLEGVGVVYASSFSKTIAPGLRVGYLLVPDHLAGSIESLAASTYVAPVTMTQATVSEFLSRGLLEPSLARIRTGLRARRDALVTALEEHLPAARWTPPAGGYFLWLELPGGIHADDLIEPAARRGVTFVPGSDFGGPESTVRLAFSAVAPRDVHAGLVRLAEVVRARPAPAQRRAA
jgi:DNA-binding transcriptional MocR family regulator